MSREVYTRCDSCEKKVDSKDLFNYAIPIAIGNDHYDLCRLCIENLLQSHYGDIALAINGPIRRRLQKEYDRQTSDPEKP